MMFLGFCRSLNVNSCMYDNNSTNSGLASNAGKLESIVDESKGIIELI